jgi:hypothetical protein
MKLSNILYDNKYSSEFEKFIENDYLVKNKEMKNDINKAFFSGETLNNSDIKNNFTDK